jgi:hypothetical protein
MTVFLFAILSAIGDSSRIPDMIGRDEAIYPEARSRVHQIMAPADTVHNRGAQLASREFEGTRSGISKEHHETEIHVRLVMAMEKSCAGVVRGEVHFRDCVSGNNQHIFI